MLNIAVCDDDLSIVDEVKAMILRYCKSRTLECKIFSYYDGEDLIKSKESFNIVFLDIEMNGLDGISTAEYIRERDMKIPIVYMTNYTDYWRRAFTVHAFYYMTKPIHENEISNVMNDYLISVIDDNDDILILPTDKGVEYLRTNEIYYFIFEAKKKVYVHTTDRRILVREHLTNIFEKLDKTHFINQDEMAF